MPEKRAKIEQEAEFWLWQHAQRRVDEIARLAEMLDLAESTVEAIWNETADECTDARQGTR
jgi:hypothetical protein